MTGDSWKWENKIQTTNIDKLDSEIFEDLKQTRKIEKNEIELIERNKSMIRV